MLTGSNMRRLTLHLIVASLTFTTGVIGSYQAHNHLSRSASVNTGIHIPAALIPAAPVRACEVHGSILKAERIQRVCGEYRGSVGGGWSHLRVGCNSPKKRRISPEDAQFFLNMSGGSNTWPWWKDYEAAQKTQFPHGYGWMYQDCEAPEARCATIDSCAGCRAAEVLWKRNSLKSSGQ